MKLELKHIAPYLPYGLKGVCKEVTYLLTTEGGSTKEFGSLNGTAGLSMFIEYCKPILRPFSDLLDKEKDFWIDLSEVSNLPHNEFLIDALIGGERYSLNYRVSIEIYEWLLSNHFDVFGLIPEQLALDINTVKS